ncbi:hypothetical protein FHY35_004017 [Xanthomonas arboricola]|uniref:hypothetical protein n=1 Tax=Xanthomonas arboricola TaxID=56448 RepID=UPI001DFC92E8|nr:hypothetical protein [Xanthomonas arboricola]NIJ86967.1 hypothetical protein [Xanthomonas arboricola]
MSDNVLNINTGQPVALAGGGGGHHDVGMDARVAKLEAIVPTLATKADVEGLRADFHKGTNELIKWVVGTSFLGIALFVTIMTFVLNNAIPKAAVQPPQQQAPIIIQVPGPPPAAAPAPTNP